MSVLFLFFKAKLHRTRSLSLPSGFSVFKQYLPFKTKINNDLMLDIMTNIWIWDKTTLFGCTNDGCHMVIIQIATFFWLIAWICLISRTFFLISWLFHDGWYNWKITRGWAGGPEGRSGGRREALRAERRPERSPEGPPAHPRVIFQLYHQSWKSEDIRKNVRDIWQIQATQPKTTSQYVW